MRRKRDLTVGEWAVLALLCERPMHGYALGLAMAADGELGQIWSLKRPLAYRALKVLESMELIEVAAVLPGRQAPDRTELHATPTAERMVARWLETPEPHVRDLRSALLLKLQLLHRRGRSPIALLTAQRELLSTQAEALAGDAGHGRPDALVQHWRRTMTEAALRFVDERLAAEQVTASG